MERQTYQYVKPPDKLMKSAQLCDLGGDISAFEWLQQQERVLDEEYQIAKDRFQENINHLLTEKHEFDDRGFCMICAWDGNA